MRQMTENANNDKGPKKRRMIGLNSKGTFNLPKTGTKRAYRYSPNQSVNYWLLSNRWYSRCTLHLHSNIMVFWTRSCISIRGCGRRSVHPSVPPLVAHLRDEFLKKGDFRLNLNKIRWGANKPQRSSEQHISASSERNLKIKKKGMKALEKTKSLPPRASKSVKPFGYETDFNGEGSNGTWKISFILDLFVGSGYGTWLKKKHIKL